MSKTTEATTKDETNKGLSVTSMFEQDAGAGTENIGKDELSIPYISLLQKTSQAVDPTSSQYVEDAKIGMFLIGGINKVYQTLNVIPVHYERQFAKYEDNNFRGYVPASVVENGINNGTFNVDAQRKTWDDEGFEYKDTRTHLLLIINPDGSTTPGILNLSSTQIKKSKTLLTQIQTHLETGASGDKFTPPSYAHVFKLSSVAEKNDNGSWSGVKFERLGYVQEAKQYEKAKALYDSVQSK